MAAIAPAVQTATVLSSKCDLAGFEACTVKVHVGTFGDAQSATIYIEAELQDSDDDSSYAAVADVNLDFPSAFSARTGHATGTFLQTKTTAAHDLAGLYEVGYHGAKRYLKVNLRLTGSHSTGTPVSASFVKTSPILAPAQ